MLNWPIYVFPAHCTCCTKYFRFVSHVVKKVGELESQSANRRWAYKVRLTCSSLGMRYQFIAFIKQVSVHTNTRCWPNVELTLAQRIWRWSNVNPTLGQCLVFAGRATLSNPVSGGQCHLIHLTILMTLSWPSLPYMWLKTSLILFHFIYSTLRISGILTPEEWGLLRLKRHLWDVQSNPGASFWAVTWAVTCASPCRRGNCFPIYTRY